MAKRTISLIYLCVGAASYSMSSPTLVPRQADGAASASSFLRRAFHSSAFLDGRLYIDGGEFSYTSNNDTVYQFSDTLISLDLTKHWTNSSVVLHSTSKPDGVPSLINGGIWADLRNKLLYTGFAGVNSLFGDANTSPQGLWSFSPDRDGGGSWENLNGTADGIFASQPRPFDGSVASGGGSGYFLGGLSGNSSNFQNTPRGMFSFDFSSQTTTYGRDSGSSSAYGTQDGGMVFVPFFGTLGIIISAGGQQRQTNSGNGGNGNGPNGGGGPGGGGGGQGGSTPTSLASFSTVQVYNPQDQKWYDQKTSGTAPTGRMQFCMTGMPSKNQTFEIFVYAGWDGNPGPGSVSFDDAYVLTLPGFHWVKADYTEEHPRYGLSCNAVGGGQVVTIGGVDPTQNNIQQNQQNNEAGYSAPFSTPDPFTQGLGVFDLSSLSWKSKYQPMPFPYTPAAQIQDYYNTNGRKPTAGFSSSSLQSLFAQTNFNSPDDLPFPGGGTGRGGYGNTSNSNAGAIVGGVVGGLAAVSAAAALFLWLRRRHANKHRKSTGNRSIDDDYDNDDDDQDSTTMRNLPADDTNARIEHANSYSRYPYSPSGFYNQPARGTAAAAIIPGTATAGTSAAPVEVAADSVELDDEEAYAHAAGEKQPPPAYEEMEGGGGGRPLGVAELPADADVAGGTTTTTVTELSSSVGSVNGTGDFRNSSTRIVSGLDDTLVSAVDIVVDGMRPSTTGAQQQQQLSLPQVPELHGDTSERAELP